MAINTPEGAGVNPAFVFDDGGRQAAGFKGKAGDCVTRAIAIATSKPYREVYDALWAAIREYPTQRRDRVARRLREQNPGTSGTTPRNGVHRSIYDPYLRELGWSWVPTMRIGSGCRVHLRADELPSGRLVVSLSRHLVAVLDGVIHDTYEDDRQGTRCVYGYWTQTP